MQGFQHLAVGANWWNNALIWRHYGYWHQHSIEHEEKYNTKAFPEWYEGALKEADKHIKDLKEPALKVKHKENPRKDYNSFSIFDANNQKIKPFTVNICKKGNNGNKVNTVEYANQRLAELKRLYDESIKALLYYQKEKVPVRPNWNSNKSDSYGYWKVKGKWIKNYVPRLEELEKRN